MSEANPIQSQHTFGLFTFFSRKPTYSLFTQVAKKSIKTCRLKYMRLEIEPAEHLKIERQGNTVYLQTFSWLYL